MDNTAVTIVNELRHMAHTLHAAASAGVALSEEEGRQLSTRLDLIATYVETQAFINARLAEFAANPFGEPASEPVGEPGKPGGRLQ